MKLSLSLLSIFILSFVFIYSCSTEEEESVAPVVQTPQPEPEPVEYTLTVSAADGGTVSTEGGTYDEGAEVTITATPDEGYMFTGWEGNVSTNESLTITLNADQTLQALFELIPIYTLTITTSQGGTVSSEGGEYEEGTEVELTTTPNEGYRFVAWIGSCLSFCENPEAQIVSYNNTIAFEIDDNVELNAQFELITQYTLEVIAGEGVTVSTEGGTYDGGTEITITATPIEGYRFVGWEGCSFVNYCEDVPNDIITYENTITFNLNSNVELRAVYYLAVSSPPDLVTNSGYEFYYNFSDGMPLEWVSYFKDLMIYLSQLIDIKPRSSSDGNIGVGDNANVYSWVLEQGSPFEDEIGVPYCTMCIYGYKNNKSFLLGLENEEVENIGIDANFHGYSVIVHEYFHIYQINQSSSAEPPYVKYIFEGGAATIESLWIQQTFGYNYFYKQNQHDAQQAIESPSTYETLNDAKDDNYSNSIFLFLALVKEIQLRGNISEIEAFKKVYVDWWSYEGERLTKEEQFELIFGFSMESFYASLSNYSPEIQSVLPSETITLEEIFEDL